MYCKFSNSPMKIPYITYTVQVYDFILNIIKVRIFLHLVCVCVHMHVCVCVCVCARAREHMRT